MKRRLVWSLAIAAALPIAGHLSLACGSSGATGTPASEAGTPDGPSVDAAATPDGSPADAPAPDADAAPKPPCTVGNDAVCGADSYCAALDRTCTSGECRRKSIGEAPDRVPVCGCDGVTYWNEVVASHAGAAVKETGPCVVPDAKRCGGFVGTTCPAGSFCRYELLDVTQCNVADNDGLCWALPTVCSTVGQPQPSRKCAGGKCTTACAAIRAQEAYYPDVTCN